MTPPLSPRSRGHPDAYTVPPPKSQVDIDVTGHVTTPTAAPAAPAPAPAKPFPTKKPRPSQNPTIQAPSPAPAEKDEEEGPYEEQPSKKKTQAVSGFAALGLSVGAAVFLAVVSTLGVALYAHKLRRRGQMREGTFFSPPGRSG